MTPDPARLRLLLQARAGARCASEMAAYMRGQFPFLGVRSPDRAAALRTWLAEAGRPGAGALLRLAEGLFSEDEREFAYAACDLLKARKRELRASDLPGLRTLVQTRSWWDTVDSLAAHPVGSVVLRHPGLSATMETWASDANLWIRRTAILHQLTYGERTDAELLFGLCSRLAHEEDFFIRKAIGWALRTYARSNPGGVRAFVRRARLSPLSLREATKHLVRT